MKNLNIKSIIVKAEHLFVAAVVFGSIGAYVMHQYDTGHAKQVQAEAQLLLKAVPAAQAAPKALSR